MTLEMISSSISMDLQSDSLPIVLQARISSLSGPNFLGILEILKSAYSEFSLTPN